MKIIHKILISVLCAAALIILAISLNRGESSKIGAVLPLTGGLASVGEDLRNGMEIAMEETGLTINFQDGAADPQKSLNAARQLADIDGVVIVLTGFRGASLSIASGLQDNNVVILSTTATAEGKSVSTSTPNLFIIGSEIVKSAEILGEHVKNTNSCKAIGLISEQTDVGKDKLNGFKSRAGSALVVFEEFFNPTSVDFRTLIAKLKSKDVDCIFVEIKSNALPVFLKQVEENAYHPRIFSTSYSVTPGVFKDVPVAQLGNIIFSSTLIDENNQLTASFLEKYKARFNRNATDFSLVGYEMVKMVEAAAEKCDKDIECIKKSLNSIVDTDTSLGKLTMGENREIQLKEYRLFRISGNSFVPVQ